MPTQDRAPSFPFYAKDWLADPKVRALTNAERGKYIDLLASMWEFSDSGCDLPMEEAVRLYGRPFVDKLLTKRILLENSFDSEPSLFSNRLSNEAQKCRSRSEAARRSVQVRWERERAQTDGA